MLCCPERSERPGCSVPPVRTRIPRDDRSDKHPLEMEINRRMSIRFPWLLGVLLLVSIALLMACGSHYAASSDGLLIVPSLGSGVLQSFSFTLSSGHPSAISNPPVLP